MIGIVPRCREPAVRAHLEISSEGCYAHNPTSMFPANEMTGRRDRRWRPVGRYSLERDFALRIVSLALFVWLVIGACAAVQRGYVTNPTANCGSSGTIAVTIIAGPMNYLGVNPKVRGCRSSIFKPIKVE